jgi:hypothetical protein
VPFGLLEIYFESGISIELINVFPAGESQAKFGPNMCEFFLFSQLTAGSKYQYRGLTKIDNHPPTSPLLE